MEFKKKDLLEIIDSNGDLIGKNDTPTTGADLESQANNTTDYNAKIGQQPFRYDMLGRFGFTLMPFMEGKEDNRESELIGELAEQIHEKRLETLKYYYKNPNKLKSDYRKLSQTGNSETTEDDRECAENIMRIVLSNLEKVFGNSESLDEAAVVEDKMVDKRGEDEMSTKGEDREMREKKIEKIAGLINKLEKKDIDKLINLLERKR